MLARKVLEAAARDEADLLAIPEQPTAAARSPERVAVAVIEYRVAEHRAVLTHRKLRLTMNALSSAGGKVTATILQAGIG